MHSVHDMPIGGCWSSYTDVFIFVDTCSTDIPTSTETTNAYHIHTRVSHVNIHRDVNSFPIYTDTYKHSCTIYGYHTNISLRQEICDTCLLIHCHDGQQLAGTAAYPPHITACFGAGSCRTLFDQRAHALQRDAGRLPGGVNELDKLSPVSADITSLRRTMAGCMRAAFISSSTRRA